MPFNIFYFDRWQHPTGLEMLNQEPAVELVKLHTDDDEANIWPKLQTIKGQKPARLLNPEVWPYYKTRFREITGIETRD